MTSSVVARHRGSLRVLAGGAGTLWVVHFATVYLFAEWQCRPGSSDRSASFAGVDLTTAVIVLATLIFGAAIVLLTRVAVAARAQSDDSAADDHSSGRSQQHTEVATIAWALAAIFVFATIVVGMTPLFLGPCV